MANLFLPEIVGADHYLSGPQICGPELTVVKDEHGFFISVTKDASGVGEGALSLYVHTENRFDPALPSVVVFDGGPGLASHDEAFPGLRGWNVIRFDQRGLGCSRPRDYATYRDLALYSSEATARDAENVRQFLRISKWAVYGSSYGTVPATIYASQFAATTMSLTLEGVIAGGGPELWNGSTQRRLLQQLLNDLPITVLRELNQFATKYHVADYWFSAFARQQMGRNHGLEALRNGLLNFATIADRIAKELRAAGRDPFVPRTPAGILAVEDPLIFAALACRELGLANPRSAIYDSLRAGRLSPSFAVMPSTTVCAPLGIADDAAKIYRAEQFPVRVPVTYFQGAEDGETDSDFALAHFKSSRQGPGQILLLRHGGHSPSQELLAEPGPLRELQLGLFTKALRGERIGPEDVRSFNARGDEHWDLTASAAP